MVAYQSTPLGDAFVVSIIQNNQVIRECNESGKRTCRIPFESEYQIRIKSKSHLRAVVRVSIDGTPVLSGSKALVLDPYTQFTLERFVDLLTEGKRFKFMSVAVGAEIGEIQDPTSAENGLVRVQIYPEKVKAAPVVRRFMGSDTPPTTTSHPIGEDKGRNAMRSSKGNPISASSLSGTYCYSSSAVNSFSVVFERETLNSALVSDTGATAEGSVSRQEFTHTQQQFETEETPLTFDIWLKGSRDDQPAPSKKDVTVYLMPNGTYQVKLKGVLLSDVGSCELHDGWASIITQGGLIIKTENYEILSG